VRRALNYVFSMLVAMLYEQLTGSTVRSVTLPISGINHLIAKTL
jgi:hypothetical protein